MLTSSIHILFSIARIKSPSHWGLTSEHIMNYVLSPFQEKSMVKTILHEAAALTSLALFIGMIAIWSQVLGNL